MKVAVYALCRNEIANIKDWVESMKEADEIIVLDTGSTDGSQHLLRTLGAKVYDYDVPRERFRFDDARNKCLSLVSKDVDICVCTDFDMRLLKGWREMIEDYWLTGTVKLLLPIVLNDEQTDIFLDRIHARHGFEWLRPIYERLYNKEDCSFRICKDVTVHVKKNKKMQLHDEKFELYRRLLLLQISEQPDDFTAYEQLAGLYRAVKDKQANSKDMLQIWV